MYFNNKINSRPNILVLKPTAKTLRPTAWMSFFSHLDPLPGIGFHTLFKPASVADYLNYPSAKMTFFATKFTKNLNLEILHFKNKGKIMLYCIYFNLL